MPEMTPDHAIKSDNVSSLGGMPSLCATMGGHMFVWDAGDTNAKPWLTLKCACGERMRGSDRRFLWEETHRA